VIRFLVKEQYSGHAFHAGGDIERKFKSFDRVSDLEDYLRFKDCNGKAPEFTFRELVGIEVL
jgi:hypothetical protein